MKLADRIGSDVPGITGKLSEYIERLAIPRKPQFMFMYRREDMPLDPPKKEREEDFFIWLGELPIPSGAFFIQIENTATLSSNGEINDGSSLGLLGYSLIEADSLAEAHEIAQQCPLIAFGVVIDVLQVKPLMDG